MTMLDAYRRELEAFLSQTGMAPSALGKRAVNDPMHVFRVRDGRAPSVRTIDKVRAFMAEVPEARETAA